MRLLDRYVLLTFLKNYLISFLVLVGMYVTIDAVYNFNKLFAVSTRTADVSPVRGMLESFQNVIDFYAYQSLLIFTYLAPVIPVVAAAFTLMRMTRFNELVATLAAGVSLGRVAVPIILASSALTFTVYVAQEHVIPSVIPKLLRDHREAGLDARRSFPVPAVEDSRGHILVAGRFDPPTLTSTAGMFEVDLVLRDPTGRPTAHLRADSARWDPEKRVWNLTGGLLSSGLLPDDVRSADRAVATLPSADAPCDLTPDDILLNRAREFVDLLPTSRINELLAQPRTRDTTDLQRVKHFRFTQHLNNILLLMLALPCVMTREPRSLKQGGIQLLGVVGLYLGTVFACQHLAGVEAPIAKLAPHWPALMAWAPVLIFGPLAIFSLDRLKT